MGSSLPVPLLHSSSTDSGMGSVLCCLIGGAWTPPPNPTFFSPVGSFGVWNGTDLVLWSAPWAFMFFRVACVLKACVHAFIIKKNTSRDLNSQNRVNNQLDVCHANFQSSVVLNGSNSVGVFQLQTGMQMFFGEHSFIAFVQ